MGFRARLWLQYVVHQKEVRPNHHTAAHPLMDGTTQGLPKVFSRRLENVGLGVREHETLASRARAAREALFEKVRGGGQWGVWCDNFFRERYVRRLRRRVGNVNATAVSVRRLQPMPGAAFFPFRGHPSLSQLVARGPALARDIAGIGESLVGICETILSSPAVRGGLIRVPLDWRRANARYTREFLWQPLELINLNCSGSRELLVILETLQKGLKPAQGNLPLLGDVNIFYRVCKCLYGVSFARADCHKWLRGMPLVFGFWHTYKYVCQIVYKKWFPFVAAFSTSLNPNTPVYNHCKLAVVEHTLASFLCAGAALRDELAPIFAASRSGGEWAAANSPAGRVWRGLGSLESFLFVGCPLAFALGVVAREVTWAEPKMAVNQDMHAAMLTALFFLLVVQQDHRGRREYVDATTISLLFHCPFFCTQTLLFFRRRSVRLACPASCPGYPI